MGAPIPQSIKIAVIEGWLKGFSCNSIADKNKIGAGTVSDIIQKVRINIPDIDLMRGVAVTLKKHSMDMDNFVSLVRLKTVLDRIGLSEEKLETLLEEINVHCIIEGKSEKEFVSQVDEVFEMASELNTTIWGINSQINQKKMEIIELDKKIAKKQEDLKNLIERYGLTADELEDYRLSKSSREKQNNKQKTIR